MPIYSFSSRSRTSTFSARGLIEGLVWVCDTWDVRTVYHVQQHGGGQEGLWGEVDGEDLLGARPSCAAEDVGSMLWWWSGTVYAAISCCRDQLCALFCRWLRLGRTN